MRIFRWMTIALAAAALLGMPSLVAAGEQGKEISGGKSMSKDLPAFEEADRNGDGELSMEEAKQAGISEKRFKEEDLDDDGKLSRITYQYDIRESEPSS